MARVIGIDYGLKRTGLAVTDPLQISINPLETLKTDDVLPFLKIFCQENDVECIVVGDPEYGTNRETTVSVKVNEFIRSLEKRFPEINIEAHCEAYSSIRARALLTEVGVKRKKRQEKGMLDKASALLILQDYLSNL